MSYYRHRTKKRQRTRDRDMVLEASRALADVRQPGHGVYTCLFCLTAPSSSASHVFPRASDLAMHLNRAHADHPGAVRCAQLLSPRGAARDTRPYPCPHPSCASGYSDKHELNYHLRHMHGHGSPPRSLAATEESLEDAGTPTDDVIADDTTDENGAAADCPMLFLDDNLTSWSFDSEVPAETPPPTPSTPAPMTTGDVFLDDVWAGEDQWLDMGMEHIDLFQ